MAIELNKVGIEIDGKVYQFYKMNFGFQRKMIELQSNMNKLINETAKKYEIEASEVSLSDKVPKEIKLELSMIGLDIQQAVANLLVNKDDAQILDYFDSDSSAKLIEALM